MTASTSYCRRRGPRLASQSHTCRRHAFRTLNITRWPNRCAEAVQPAELPPPSSPGGWAHRPDRKPLHSANRRPNRANLCPCIPARWPQPERSSTPAATAISHSSSPCAGRDHGLSTVCALARSASDYSTSFGLRGPWCWRGDSRGGYSYLRRGVARNQLSAVEQCANDSTPWLV